MARRGPLYWPAGLAAVYGVTETEATIAAGYYRQDLRAESAGVQ